MLYLPNCEAYTSLVLGIVAAGGVCSLSNPLYNRQELGHQLSTGRSKFLISLFYHCFDQLINRSLRLYLFDRTRGT